MSIYKTTLFEYAFLIAIICKPTTNINTLVKHCIQLRWSCTFKSIPCWEVFND